MNPSRFMLVEAVEDADAADLDSDPVSCSSFKAKPRLFSASGQMHTVDVELESVLNASSLDVKSGQTYPVHQDISGFWVYSGESGASQMITFTFEDPPDSSSEESLPGSSSSEWNEDSCDSRSPSAGPFYGRVQKKACGMESVPGESEDGLVPLSDDLGILDGRSHEDIIGRTGFAVRMSDHDGSGSSQEGSSGDEGSCYWMIVIVNFWRVVQVVEDVVITGTQIIIKRKNVTVWDDCSLDSEIIEGTDCPEESESSSSSEQMPAD